MKLGEAVSLQKERTHAAMALREVAEDCESVELGQVCEGPKGRKGKGRDAIIF